MSDIELTERQKVIAAAGTLSTLKGMSESNDPNLTSAPEEHISVAKAAGRAYTNSKPQFCTEGNEAWEKESQKLFDQFGRVASITDPYIARREELDLKYKVKELGKAGQELESHCAAPQSSGTSSPKL